MNSTQTLTLKTDFDHETRDFWAMIFWTWCFVDLSVQFSSVAQSCPTLCDPMNRSTPGLPVHHQLPGFTQTHIHRVSDAIQPSHPLSSPSPPAPNPSQHQSLFQRVSSLHEVAKVLEFRLQHHSLQSNPRADLLQNASFIIPFCMVPWRNQFYFFTFYSTNIEYLLCASNLKFQSSLIQFLIKILQLNFASRK